jgi:hypothetical protein
MSEMRNVVQSPEDEKLVREIYQRHQENNQRAHDQARASIAAEFNISEEEAEGHPDMEQRFEQIREQMAHSNGVVSLDPNTGEPGAKIPISMPTPAPAAVPGYAAPAPVSVPPPIPTSDVVALENIVRANGYQVVQSASDYTQGIITLVISR